MDGVDLPVTPPLAPMLAKAQATVPAEVGVWSYEPKWDGFRALVFRDGDEVVLQSRNGKDLGRYFPELVDALRAEIAPQCVLDGEVVVPREIDGRVRLDWDSLSQRIHPADSRVRMLAEQTPAHFIAFDALAAGRLDALDFIVDVARCHLWYAGRRPATDRGATANSRRARYCGTGYRLSRRKDQTIVDAIAKLFRVALDELALQSLPFGTELEGDVVEPYVPIVVAIALDLGEAPFAVCLRQVEATGGTVALEECSLALQSVRKLL